MSRIVQLIEGAAGDTTRVVLSDVASVLSSAIILNEQTKAKRLIVTVETYSVRFALGNTTPTTTTGHLLAPGDVLVLEQKDNIESAEFINAVVGENAVIQVTAFF